jgi:hypothetical protein
VAKRIRELNERGFFLSCFCFQNFPFSWGDRGEFLVQCQFPFGRNDVW